jgi:hypothetical protein
MDRQLTERLAFILNKSGDAAAAAERLFEGVQERRSHRIGNFADGVTSPRDEPWHKRHPLIAGGIGALIALVVALIFGLFAEPFK